MTRTRNRTALGYVRASQDRSGERLSVQRQADAVRDLAASRGLALLDVVEENDTSATKGERARWQTVLDRLRAREVDTLVVYGVDRAVRRRRDLAELLDVCASSGIDVEAVNGGSLATSTPAGRMAAGMIGTVAQAETETMSLRMKAANEQRARNGAHRPRGTRTYGFTRAGEPIEAELAVVREVFARVAAGEPVYAISADLASRGVLTTRGRPWTRAATRYVVGNDRYLGRSTLHRRVDGRRVAVLTGEAPYGPVVDESLFARAGAVLTAHRAPARPVARWLLVSGVGTCWCGLPLAAVGRADRTFYRCRDHADHGSRLAERIDDAVVNDLVIPRLVLDRGVRRRDEDAAVAAEREVADLDERMSSLAAAYAAGALTVEAYAGAVSAVEAAAREAREALAAAVAGPVLDVPEGAGEDEVRAAWEALPVAERREVVRALFTLSMGRAGRGRWGHPLLGFTIGATS